MYGGFGDFGKFDGESTLGVLEYARRVDMLVGIGI